jgi:hypothetical protein
MLQGNIPGTLVRWMLVKNPDNIVTADATSMWSNTITPTAGAQIIRKFCLSAGALIINSSSQIGRLNVFIRKKAMGRIGHLNQGDTLQLWIHNGHATQGITLLGVGRITTRDA